MANPSLLAWIAKPAAGGAWITAMCMGAIMCMGAMLLTAAGPAKSGPLTRHWRFVVQFRARGEASEVLVNIRYVRDGDVVAGAGVSAGIDLALWRTGRMHGPGFARKVQRAMLYAPAPPYAAEG